MIEIKMMKPKKVDRILTGDNYIYETKYDGGSAILVKRDGKIEIYHEGERRRTYRYPELRESKDNIKDGIYACELCVFNDKGVSDFRLFQKRQVENKFKIELRRKMYPVVAMIYDVLEDGKEDVRDYTLIERKKILERNILDCDSIRIVEYYETPDRILQMKNKGIEGIVNKDKLSPYLEGKRDKWYKFRFMKEETVKVVDFEDWRAEQGRGVVLITDKGKRINLAGEERVEVFKKLFDENGHVYVEIEYYDETDKGLRFPVVKRILGGDEGGSGSI